MSDIEKLMSALMEVQLDEKKKLDPVGKEDDDIDNDGDTDSSDEYLKNRRKKVGQAMKKEGKIPPQFLKNVKKKKGEDDDSDDDDDKDDKKPDFLKKKKEEGYGKMKKEGKVECPKCEGKGCNHCDDKGYHMKEENIDELSTKTMTSYISKASKSDPKLSAAKQDKRYAGVNTASKKVDKKLSMEDTLASLESGRMAKWTEFAEAYDEVNFKGKKRPQDMPIGQSSIRDVESDKHTKGATPPEGIMDKESEKSKQFYKDHQKSDKEWEDKEDQGHDDVSKAGRGVKTQSPNRKGRDNRSGDTNIINQPKQKY